MISFENSENVSDLQGSFSRVDSRDSLEQALKLKESRAPLLGYRFEVQIIVMINAGK
jgi:hypothetical protein